MRDTLQALLQQERAAGFPSFAGTDVAGTLPIRETLLNAAATQLWPTGGVGPITAIQIRFAPGNKITCQLTTDQWPLPKQFNLEMMIAPAVDLREDPRLLILLQLSGLLGFGIKTFLNSYEKLPSFITFSDGRVFINLQTLFVRSNIGDLFPLLKTLRFRTDTGTLYVDFTLHIDEKTS